VIRAAFTRPLFRRRSQAALLSLGLLFLLGSACRPDEDDYDLDGGEEDEEEQIEPVPKRTGSVLLDGCSVDAGQQASLAGAEARKVVSEVVLVCLSLTDSGGVSLRQGQTAGGLAQQIQALRGLGYSVQLGVTAVDEDDDEQPADELSRWLRRSQWQRGTVQALATYAQDSDGIQLLLPELEDSARSDLSAWVSALSAKLRPARRLALFAPPSLTQPSDIAGGEAYDLSALAPKVDRIRLLTIEAASGDAPGPTLDADWVLQAATFAGKSGVTDKLDVSVPLYGIDFRLTTTPTRQIADETPVSYAEAQALSLTYGVTPQGGDGEALHFSYKTNDGQEHEVWYEDSASILQGLRALPTASLPPSAGVVYFGVGGEDPELFADLAEAMGVSP
jgi:spore germination protein YaaH